jgi:hypothetical protein
MFRRRLKLPSLWCLAVYAAASQSQSTAPGPIQPLPFSHRAHVFDAKLTCTDCHVYPQKFGDPVSLPDAKKCLECHGFSTNPTPTRGALNAFVEKKQPIPWIRVFALRDFVFFDHRYHLMNGVLCQDCHGPIDAEDVVTDRLKTTSMTFCQPCHVKTRAQTGCGTCHDPR